MFRIGHFDEALPSAGITHLAEHLVHSCAPLPRYPFNALVDGRFTSFIMSSSDAVDIEDFVVTVCQCLIEDRSGLLEREERPDCCAPRRLAADRRARPSACLIESLCRTLTPRVRSQHRRGSDQDRDRLGSLRASCPRYAAEPRHSTGTYSSSAAARVDHPEFAVVLALLPGAHDLGTRIIECRLHALHACPANLPGLAGSQIDEPKSERAPDVAADRHRPLVRG